MSLEISAFNYSETKQKVILKNTNLFFPEVSWSNRSFFLAAWNLFVVVVERLFRWNESTLAVKAR